MDKKPHNGGFSVPYVYERGEKFMHMECNFGLK